MNRSVAEHTAIDTDGHRGNVGGPSALRPREFSFEDSTVFYADGGAGLPALLLQGVGPGSSSLGSYRLVLGHLVQRFHVYAMDLIGFGRSGRKASPPFFDFALWSRQLQAML